MTTRLPKNILSFLDQYADAFGGSDVVLTLLPDKDIEALVTFPGEVRIVKPWAAVIDMQEFGYQPGEPYSVLDNNLRIIHTRYSQTGYFGTEVADQDLLINAQHGSFMFLSFGRTLVLLWVCNKLSPRQIEQQVERWIKEGERYGKQKIDSELFLSTRYLLPDDDLYITFLTGMWSQHLSATELRSNPNAQTTTHKGNDEIISLRLQQSGWYLFQVVRDSTVLTLELAEITGVGVNSVRSHSSGVYFISVNSQRTRTPLASSIGLPSNQNGVLGADPYIRLEANLKLKEPDLIVGTAQSVAKINVQRNFRSIASEGSSLTRSSIGISIDAVAIAPAIASLPLLLESEKLLTIGVAPFTNPDNIRFAGVGHIALGVATTEAELGVATDSVAQGESETEADIGIIYSFTTLYLPDYQHDPFMFAQLGGDVASTTDPLERMWYTNEFQPYLHISEADASNPQPMAVGVAISEAEFDITT